MLSEVQSLVYIIGGLVLLFGYIVIRYAILGTSGYIAKTVVLTIIAVIMLVAVDFSVGYNGWSVNYAFPSGILLIDVGIVVCMSINRKNWQSYLMVQIFMVLCSVVAIILSLVQIITDSMLSVVALNVSVILLLGTLIIGGDPKTCGDSNKDIGRGLHSGTVGAEERCVAQHHGRECAQGPACAVSRRGPGGVQLQRHAG